MDGAFHYRMAERLLWLAGPDSAQATRDELLALIWTADVHATLASAAANIEGGGPTVPQRWRDALAQRDSSPAEPVVPVVPEEKPKTPRRRSRKAAENPPGK